MIKNILILGGKGGTGKSSISVAITKYLNEQGMKTAYLDLDLDCPNAGQFFEVNGSRLQVDDDLLIPLIGKLGDIEVEVVSLGFLMPEDSAILWESTQKREVVEQFHKREIVKWAADTEIVVIDAPAGTGVVLGEALALKPDATIIVTTPHSASLADATRAYDMLRENNAVFAGTVLNMAGLICPSCNVKLNYEMEAEIPQHLTTIPYDPLLHGKEYLISKYMVDVEPAIMKALKNPNKYRLKPRNKGAGRLTKFAVKLILKVL